ncbi:MAG: ABC transporter substrate-binding protein [Syntrophobacterales bacterium]|nr:ABC transporter substrate-binding protein [Syntrophobacterales bacterium]
MKKLFTDQLGKTHHFSQTPRRIISLVPSQTELLFDLGLDEEIIGITDFCIHPKEKCDHKPRIGGPKSVNFQLIDQLQPDVIIANKEENAKGEIKKLEEKYPVWISDIYTLEDALDMIRGIGELVGRPSEANDIISRIALDIGQVEDLQIRTAYFIWQEPYMVAGEDTFINEMLKKCGLTNVFSSLPRYPAVTEKQIKDARPQIILLCSEPYLFEKKHVREFEERFPFARAFLVDGEIFSWYGSRLRYAGNYFKYLRGRISSVLNNEV